MRCRRNKPLNFPLNLQPASEPTRASYSLWSSILDNNELSFVQLSDRYIWVLKRNYWMLNCKLIFLWGAPAIYQPNATVERTANVRKKGKFFQKLSRGKEVSKRCSLSIRALNLTNDYFSETDVQHRALLGISHVISRWDPARLNKPHSGNLWGQG